MKSLVIDTNVVSYLLKNDSRAEKYKPHLEGCRGCLSFMSVAELYRWAIHNQWQQQRVEILRGELRQYVVLPYDDQTAWEWARIMSIKGRPIAPSDAWIAASALRHGIPLVTHNYRHFANIPELQLITEAE